MVFGWFTVSPHVGFLSQPVQNLNVGEGFTAGAPTMVGDVEDAGSGQIHFPARRFCTFSDP